MLDKRPVILPRNILSNDLARASTGEAVRRSTRLLAETAHMVDERKRGRPLPARASDADPKE
jgi:hypothetical protein